MTALREKMLAEMRIRGYSYCDARGTKVAREWSEFEPFLRWAIQSGARRGLWLTRIDRTKDYGPRNCTWARGEDALRKRGPPSHGPGPRRLITALGEMKGLLEWARDPRCPVSAPTISHRLALGWDRKTAITAPPGSPGPKGMTFRKVRAYGEVKGPMAWARDRRCRVGITGLMDRLRRGWKADDAISTEPFTVPVGARR